MSRRDHDIVAFVHGSRRSGLICGLGMAAAVSTSHCNALRATDDCDSSTDCPRGTSCASGKYCRTGAPIAIGLLLTLTGPQGGSSQARVDGTAFGNWILDAASSNKVLGRGLRFELRDTLGAVDQASLVTSSVIDANVAAVLGPFSSAEVFAAQQLTFPRQLLQIGVEAGGSSLGDAQPGGLRKRFLFQFSPEIHDGIVRAIPLLLASSARPANYDTCFSGVALVVNDDTTGTSFRTTLEDMLPRNCIPVTKTIAVPRDNKSNYDAEADALLAAAKDGVPTQCLFMSVFPDVAGSLLRTLEARRATSRAPYSAFFGSGVLHVSNFWSEAKSPIAGKPSLAEGFHVMGIDQEPPRSEFRDMLALWHAYVETRPDIVERERPLPEHVIWAESVVLLGLAFELAGRAEDPIALRDAFLDVVQGDEGDLGTAPKDIGLALARIRAARAEGRRAAIDYRGAFTDYQLNDRGYIDIPTVMERMHDGTFERAAAFTTAELAHAWDQPGPACGKGPH